MSEWEVTVARNIVESAKVKVTADNLIDAEEKAIRLAYDGEVEWKIDVDSCGKEPPYIHHPMSSRE